MLFTVLAACLPCPVLGVAAAGVRSARAVAAQEALLDVHTTASSFAFRDRQGLLEAKPNEGKPVPDSSDDATISETMSEGKEAMGKLDQASEEINKLTDDSTSSRPTQKSSGKASAKEGDLLKAQASLKANTIRAKIKKLKVQRKKAIDDDNDKEENRLEMEIKQLRAKLEKVDGNTQGSSKKVLNSKKNFMRVLKQMKQASKRKGPPGGKSATSNTVYKTHAQAADADSAIRENSTASSYNASDANETLAEERFDDVDVLGTPIWTMYVWIKDHFQNEMVTAMMTGRGDYAVLYSALFLIGAWIILCIHRGKHQAARGIGTLICVGCFIPCGAVALCCPIDEYTPTEEEFRHKDEREIKP